MLRSTTDINKPHCYNGGQFLVTSTPCCVSTIEANESQTSLWVVSVISPATIPPNHLIKVIYDTGSLTLNRPLYSCYFPRLSISSRLEKQCEHSLLTTIDTIQI